MRFFSHDVSWKIVYGVALKISWSHLIVFLFKTFYSMQVCDWLNSFKRLILLIQIYILCEQHKICKRFCGRCFTQINHQYIPRLSWIYPQLFLKYLGENILENSDTSWPMTSCHWPPHKWGKNPGGLLSGHQLIFFFSFVRCFLPSPHPSICNEYFIFNN